MRKSSTIVTTHDIRKEFPELVARIDLLTDELKEVMRDHDSGYGGTYNPVYAAERERMAWETLRRLARDADEIATWLAPSEEP